MQFCNPHWKQLRTAIEDKGMFHLVSKSGIQAVGRLVKEAKGQAVAPDPLMEAHNMILSRSLECLGVYIMLMKDDGFAPLPSVERLPEHPKTKLKCGDWWISSLSEYLRFEYEKEGWLNSN